MEVKFTALFPAQPPVIRLIRPRLEYLTGNITFGGTFCNDLLTNWKGMSMHSLLTKLRQSLIDDAARVDLRTANLYDAHVAAKALTRQKRDISAEIATINNFHKKLFVYSNEYATKIFDGLRAPEHIELGNRILLPPSAADTIFNCPDFTMPLM